MQKETIVLDSSTVVAAVFWKGDARRCLVAAAQRKFMIAGSSEIFGEYRKAASAVKRKTQSAIDPKPMVDWLESIARKVEPIAFTSRLSRDKSDNVFIGCALAANASFIVTHDPDLLILKKPFGIEILRPREFLRKISL
ncbi:MAG TPA: putative toxin-antitoxin system toxin component, PIN family [Verrucomicrobiae bacterium]